MKEERSKFDVELSAVFDQVFYLYKMSCWADLLNTRPLRLVDRLSDLLTGGRQIFFF